GSRLASGPRPGAGRARSETSPGESARPRHGASRRLACPAAAHPRTTSASSAREGMSRMESYIAEFFGTMILVLLGDGVVAGVLLRESKAENAGWFVITFGWGMAVAIAVYAIGF